MTGVQTCALPIYKARLLKYRISSRVNLYTLDGFTDYFYGYMVPDTGYLQWFALELFEEMCIRDRLFAQRMNTAAGIAAYKKEHGLPVLDPVREREKLLDVAAQAPEDMRDYTASLYTLSLIHI